MMQPFDLLAIVDEIIPPEQSRREAETSKSTQTSHMSYHTSDSSRLDVERLLTHYGYSYKVKQKGDRTIYILDTCLFNPEHNRGEACITQDAGGKLGYKCHHNSCANKGWQEAKAVIGDPKPFYTNRQSDIPKAVSTDTTAKADRAESEPAKSNTDFDSILQEIGQAAVILDDHQKSQAVIQIVDQVVFLEPAEQTTLIERMKAVGLGTKSSLEAQLKKAKQRRASERNAERREQAQADNNLPTIETTFRHLRDMTQDTLDAILLQNEKAPRIFVRGGVLTRIKPYESQSLICEVMTASAVRGEIERAANFVGGRDYLGNPISMPINPPTDVVSDLMALPEWKGIPILKGITHAPVLNADGTFDHTQGYQSKSQTFYSPDKTLKIGDTEPTDDNVGAAKLLIFDDLLGEFCFADQDSKANALALMLMPFVRPIIDGQTPLHLIDAPVEGSGKGLLADVLTYPFKPDGGTLMTEGESDEEWRKRITAVLSEAPSHVMIDNINKRLESGSLAAVLTAKVWSDRQLGTNTTLKFPVTQTWIATGNNVEMSPEITRRVVWIRLRPSVEDPSQMEFRIKDLRKWALEHRSELVTACLTLIRKWVALGMREGNVRKGSYESWAAIMSGILDAVGVEGFLGNYARLGEKANEDSGIWREFVRAWHQEHGTNPVGVADLFVIASIKEVDEDGRKMEVGQNLLGELLRSEKVNGRRKQLGDLLKTQVDRVYGNYRILRAGLNKNAAQYRLERIGEHGEHQKASSPKCSPIEKHSDDADSSVSGEHGEHLHAHAGGGEGYIDSPPGEVSQVETTSPSSPIAKKAALTLNVSNGEHYGEHSKPTSPSSSHDFLPDDNGNNGTHPTVTTNDDPKRLDLLVEIRQLETELGHHHREDIKRWDIPTLRDHRWKLKEKVADTKGREVFRI